MDRLLTLREVCEASRMSLPKLFRLRRSGLGPREIRHGRAVLVSEAALRDWIEGMEHKPDRAKVAVADVDAIDQEDEDKIAA